MTILQASFFWKNNEPGGLGLTFGLPNFTPQDLQTMFDGRISKEYMRNSDLSLGSHIVNDMLAQLTSVGQAKMRNEPIPPRMVTVVALNILWLTSRGFIPNDEFNGVQFVHHMAVKPTNPNGAAPS